MKGSSDVISLVIIIFIFSLVVYLAFKYFVQKSFSLFPEEENPNQSLYDDQKIRMQEIKEQQDRLREQTQQRIRDLRR